MISGDSNDHVSVLSGLRVSDITLDIRASSLLKMTPPPLKGIYFEIPPDHVSRYDLDIPGQ